MDWPVAGSLHNIQHHIVNSHYDDYDDDEHAEYSDGDNNNNNNKNIIIPRTCCTFLHSVNATCGARPFVLIVQLNQQYSFWPSFRPLVYEIFVIVFIISSPQHPIFFWPCILVQHNSVF